MRIVTLLVLLLPCSIVAAERHAVTVNDLMKIRNVGEAWISPDGASVVYVLSTLDEEQNRYNSDLWLVRVRDRKSGQLTRHPGRDDSPRWSPSGKSIAFLSDRSGKPQLWLLPLNGGDALKLSDHPTAISDLAWSPDEKSIAFLAPDPETDAEKSFKKERGDVQIVGAEVKPSHLHLIEVDSGKSRRLTSGNFHVNSFDWSPDGKSIAYTTQASPRPRDGVASELHLLTVENGATRALLREKGTAARPRFSPDGRQIAVLARLEKSTWLDSPGLVLVSLQGEVTKTFPENDHFRFAAGQSFVWDTNGSIVFALDQGTTRHLVRTGENGSHGAALTKSSGVHDRLSIDRERTSLVLVREDPRHPPEVYLLRLETGGLQQLTDHNPQVKEWEFGSVETLRYRSKDGLEIEGLLVKPVGFKEGTRYPLLTYIHGGPALQFMQGFALYPPGTIQASRYPVQVFAGQGYAVFCPNPRGSSAYGEKFRKANVGDWGGKDFEDVMAGVDVLIEKGIADPDRLGIMGWSYGGYMTNWAITQTNRFKAASTGAGLSNLVSMYGQTDIPNFMENYFGGPMWEKRPDYEKRSPMTFIDQVKTPTLIQFGAQDERVPLAQGQELYTTLKRRGVPVEFAIYPRQGHNVTEPRLQRDVQTRNLEWFNRWLKKG